MSDEVDAEHKAVIEGIQLPGKIYCLIKSIKSLDSSNKLSAIVIDCIRSKPSGLSSCPHF